MQVRAGHDAKAVATDSLSLSKSMMLVSEKDMPEEERMPCMIAGLKESL